LNLSRRKYAGLGLIACVLGVGFFLFAPVVTYSTSFSIPRNFGSHGNVLQPVSIVGQAPLAYSLLGYGSGPYPDVALVSQGNGTALVYFHGSKIVMAEGPLGLFGRVPLFPGPVILYPPGSIQITNVNLTPSANGLLNFSAIITGVPYTSYGRPFISVYFDYPGYGSNTTSNGVVWHTPLSSIECSVGLNGDCLVSRVVAASPTLLQGESYPMTIVVFGMLVTGLSNSTSVNQAGQTLVQNVPETSSFVYVQKASVTYPGAGPNAAWVQAFFNLVNAQRGSGSFTEDSALDSFAKLRFQTVVSKYVITDYGFDNQSAAYFNGTGKISTEEILYPGTFAPDDFVSYLQQKAPGHWSALVNLAYNSYGYYLGYGPVVEVNTGCPVTEISQRNMNITAIAIQNGCKYKVLDETYLLIVLSN
jgi:hypothetical protein